MYGNGVVGILSESCFLWDRRSPSNCIIVQPCTKRIHHGFEYEDVGCEISDDLSECGIILEVKQPKMEMIKLDRDYTFFSHTHKAQRENFPFLDEILKERASLYDYELIVGENGRRLLAFGKFADRILAVGEEITTLGLPSGISPVVFVPCSIMASLRSFLVCVCVVTCEDLVTPLDPTKTFDKADLNCMYCERRFPRLLSTKQLQDIMRKGFPLFDISDITCDVAGSIECGEGIICLAVDILPTEVAREATQYIGDVLSNFIGVLASTINISDLPHLRRGCTSHKGVLTPLYEYIPCMRNSDSVDSPLNPCNGLHKKYTILVSLSGHLFDEFLSMRCEVGQSADALSFAELEVGVDDQSILDQIVYLLSFVTNPSDDSEARVSRRGTNRFSLKVGKVGEKMVQAGDHLEERLAVLILGAGRVCQQLYFLCRYISKSEVNQNCLVSCLIKNICVVAETMITTTYIEQYEIYGVRSILCEFYTMPPVYVKYYGTLYYYCLSKFAVPDPNRYSQLLLSTKVSPPYPPPLIPFLDFGPLLLHQKCRASTGLPSHLRSLLSIIYKKEGSPSLIGVLFLKVTQKMSSLGLVEQANLLHTS
ncbi:hypothetical protein AMTRI_Chr01g109530 [Amborella trichopoda]